MTVEEVMKSGDTVVNSDIWRGKNKVAGMLRPELHKKRNTLVT